MKILESERLILRDWRISDLEDLHEFASNKKVADMAGFRLKNNKDESLAALKKFILEDDNEKYYYLNKDAKLMMYLGGKSC